MKPSELKTIREALASDEEAFFEVIRDAERECLLQRLPASTMVVRRWKGAIVGYEQLVGSSGTPIQFGPDQILHIRRGT